MGPRLLCPPDWGLGNQYLEPIWPFAGLDKGLLGRTPSLLRNREPSRHLVDTARSTRSTGQRLSASIRRICCRLAVGTSDRLHYSVQGGIFSSSCVPGNDLSGQNYDF